MIKLHTLVIEYHRESRNRTVVFRARLDEIDPSTLEEPDLVSYSILASSIAQSAE